jgi:hypothetical protein
MDSGAADEMRRSESTIASLVAARPVRIISAATRSPWARIRSRSVLIYHRGLRDLLGLPRLHDEERR